MIFRDGLVVVIDDDDRVGPQFDDIVQAFIGQPARKRTVPDDCHNIVIFLFQIPRFRHTIGQGKGGGSMPNSKQIMVAFLGIGVARYIVKVGGIGKCLAPARQHFVDIRLM